MNKGIFITGTDTGVGKTFVAVNLIHAMREKGISVCPMKPVETGCSVRKGGLVPADAVALMKASGVKEPVSLINPYRFRYPVSPAAASEREGTVIRRDVIISAFRKLSAKYDVTIVEGAGGVMVPVFREYLFLDLVSDLDLPLVVVSRPGLGTINHTLLTIHAARNRGIRVAGVVINHATGIRKDVSVRSNPGVIERLGGVQVLGIVPHGKYPGTRLRREFTAIAGKILSVPGAGSA